MLRLPLARRALLATALLSVVLFGPSAAWAETPNPSACSGLHHGQKPGSLAITTSPATDTVLRPGDEVEVTATWDSADWGRPVLHKVLNCLLVNGSIDYDRSFQEKPTDNDGLYRYRFTVPSGAGRICDRVRLSGRIVDGGDLVVQKSNTVCFSIQAAGGSGSTGTPAGPATSASAPPADDPAPLAPAPVLPGTGAPAEPPATEITSVSYVPTLPRTGGDPLPLARLGTLLVLLGGAALATRAALTRQAAPSALRI